MNTEILQEGLKKLKQQQFEKSWLQDYYDGEYDIKKNYPERDGQSNEIVVLNYSKKFVEERIAFSLANPVNMISKSGNEEALGLIDMNFSHWQKLHDQEVVRQSQIFGEAYEVLYLNQDGEFRAGVLNPLNAIVFQSGDIENKVTMAIHEYDIGDNDYIDVYTPKEIITYRVDADNFVETNRREHIFNGVPITVCKGNARSHSLIEDIKSPNSALNRIYSDAINELGDHRAAYLKVLNATLGDKENADAMKRSGIIEINGEKADAEWLIKNLPDGMVKTMLENLENKIYQMANSVDTTQELQSNLSGAALKSRLISIAFVCSTIEAQLEYTIKQRLKHFFDFHYKKTGERFEYRDIRIKTTPNIPNELTSIADSSDKLKNIVSQETLLGLLPFVENPSLEKAKFDAEQASKIQSLNDIR